MANKLKLTIRLYMSDSEPSKRYVRIDEMAKDYGMVQEEMEMFAVAAGALYKLPHISLIHNNGINQFRDI